MPALRSCTLLTALMNSMVGISVASAQAVSTLQQPASPPVVQLAEGKLTIDATNSSLRTILDDLEHRTGTRVQGLTADQRIFGVYGPGNPQEVLSSLLDDSGYNVLISGRQPDGAPREIVLSSKTAPPPNSASNTMTQAGEEDGQDAYTPAPPRPILIPLPTPASQAAPGPRQVRTPQQMLQELERLRQNTQGNNASSNEPQ